MAPVLKKIEEADGIILGSPIYIGNLSGEMRSFSERLLFPYVTYTNPLQSLFPKRIPTGFIYTMGVTEEQMKELGYQQSLNIVQMLLGLVFGPLETLCSFDTVQFKDYSKIVADMFDPEAKARRRKEVFPEDCEKALALGKRLAQAVEW